MRSNTASRLRSAQPLGADAVAGRRRQGDPDRGAARRRSGAAQRHRSRSGNSGSRPQACGGAICAAGGEPHPARLRSWSEPGIGGGDAAWRRTQARRRPSRIAATLAIPARAATATGLRLKRRMCHRRWHELIREGRRGPTLSGRAVRGRTACVRSRQSRAATGRLADRSGSRSRRLRSTISSTGFRAPEPFSWVSPKPLPICSISFAPMARARSGCSNANRSRI